MSEQQLNKFQQIYKQVLQQLGLDKETELDQTQFWNLNFELSKRLLNGELTTT